MTKSLWTSPVATVAVLGVALAGAVAGCGDDDDDDAGTTTAAPVTTEAPEPTASPDSTPAPETTATPDTTSAPETTAPGEVVVADFNGAWEAASFVVTSQDDPSVTLDVIALGVVLTADADVDGNITGQAEVPEAFGGPITLDFTATFEVVDQETMAVAFVPNIPPLLTSFTGPFTFDGETLTITDENAVFDFDDGNGEVPAIAVTTLVTTPG